MNVHAWWARQRQRGVGNERGWAMFMAYGATAVLLLLVGSLIDRSLVESRATQQYRRMRISYYAAEGLANVGLAWFRDRMTQDPPVPPPSEELALWPSAAPEVIPPPELQAIPGMSLRYLSIAPYVSTPPIRDAYQIRAQTIGPQNLTRDFVIIAQVERFHDFAYFMGSGGLKGEADVRAHVWFRSGQVFRGDVHSNGYLFLQGSPVFHGALTTAKPEIMYWNAASPFGWIPPPWTPYPDPFRGDTNSSGTNDDGITPTYPADTNPVNQDGVPLTSTGKLVVNAPTLPFPDPDATMAELIQEAKSGGYHYVGDRTIQIDSSSGTNQLLIYDPATFSTETKPLPPNGLLCVEGNLTVSQVAAGVTDSSLDGALTLCANPYPTTSSFSGNVIIGQNIRYASELNPATAAPRDPVTNKVTGPPPQGTDDMLAIIARREIVVQLRPGASESWFEPPQIDREIFGTLMALGDSVRTPFVFAPGAYPPMLVAPDSGTLTVVGGIIQNIAAPVGTRDADGAMHGYTTNFVYDTRVKEIAMPFIPTTGRVRIVDIWTIPPESPDAVRRPTLPPPPPG
ncbi:MAG: hypothetical protein HY597_01320 [Candidatus Omnitrophica bacterium]|nr:hypothetical protein [Candidatus Omnitrophota bacterium]